MADYEGAKESAHKDVEVLTSAYYVWSRKGCMWP